MLPCTINLASTVSLTAGHVKTSWSREGRFLELRLTQRERSRILLRHLHRRKTISRQRKCTAEIFAHEIFFLHQQPKRVSVRLHLLAVEAKHLMWPDLELTKDREDATL